MNLSDIAVGSSMITQTIYGKALDLYVYKPHAQALSGVFFSCHGTDRNADDYRDRAITVGDSENFLVVAPEFKNANTFGPTEFYNYQYHRGGLYFDGTWYPEAQWTPRYFAALVDWARALVGGPQRVWMFGHSAGAQALSRVAAFAPDIMVDRYILANSSSYVWPDIDEAAPYGFGGSYGYVDGAAAAFNNTVMREALLKNYLAAPISVYLGGDDTDPSGMDDDPQAQTQGENRLLRGVNTFAAARAAAEAKGWPFNWSLVVAPGIGHSSTGMLANVGMDTALRRRGSQVATNAATLEDLVELLGAQGGVLDAILAAVQAP